jgi:hypothetical protein
MKSSVCWGMLLCSVVKVNWHFRGIYGLHLQGCRVGNKSKKSAWLTLWPWKLRWYVPPKCWLTVTGLYSIISQKTEIFTGNAYICEFEEEFWVIKFVTQCIRYVWIIISRSWLDIKLNKTKYLLSSAHKKLINILSFYGDCVQWVLLGDQPCENGISVQCFRDSFYFCHHSEVDVVNDTSVILLYIYIYIMKK